MFDRSKIFVLWLDTHIGQDDNCRDLKNEFRRLTRSIRIDCKVDDCKSYLPNIKDRKVFCIIQGRLAADIVPDIEEIIPANMEPVVYIFCQDKSKYTEFGQQHESIKRGEIFDHQKHLLNRLTTDLNNYVFGLIGKYLAGVSNEQVINFTAKVMDLVGGCYRMKNAPTTSLKPSVVAN